MTTKGESSEKALKGLTEMEGYRRIRLWHINNKRRIFEKYGYRKPDDPYVMCYQKLVDHLPDPKEATRADIAFLCIEVISGLMEWAYHEKDENGVKTSAYAHYLLGTFFDGFGGTETRSLYRKSKMSKNYSMASCLASTKPAPIDRYLEELLRTSDSDGVSETIQLLLKQAKENPEKVVDAAVRKISANDYDGSKWSTLAFSISVNFGNHKEVSRILEELVKKEPENAAYHNNLGVNYLSRSLFGSALKSFAQAYALDYRANGNKAAELPAWKNLISLCNRLDKSQTSVSEM